MGVAVLMAAGTALAIVQSQFRFDGYPYPGTDTTNVTGETVAEGVPDIPRPPPLAYRGVPDTSDPIYDGGGEPPAAYANTLITEFPTGGEATSTYDGPVGAAFTVTTNLTVGQLGLWQGTNKTERSHHIGVWAELNGSQGRMLGRIPITLPVQAVTGDYVYATLSNPIVLTTGETYRLSWDCDGTANENYPSEVNTWTDSDYADLTGSAYYTSGDGFDYPITIGSAGKKSHGPVNMKFNLGGDLLDVTTNRIYDFKFTGGDLTSSGVVDETMRLFGDATVTNNAIQMSKDGTGYGHVYQTVAFTQVTVRVWLNMDSYRPASGHGGLYYLGMESGSDRPAFPWTTGTWYLGEFNNSRPGFSDPLSQAELEDWWMLTMVQENDGSADSYRIYANATEIYSGTGTNTGGPLTQFTDMYLGSSDSSFAYMFDGLFDDFTIFGYAMTGTQVSNLYVEGRSE
jgi:hypothetical protein